MRSQSGDPNCRAIPAGVKKIPTPIASPAVAAMADPSPSCRCKRFLEDPWVKDALRSSWEFDWLELSCRREILNGESLSACQVILRARHPERPRLD